MNNFAAEYPEIKLYIDGQWTGGAGGRGDDVVNPATEEVIGRVPFAEPSDVDAAIAAAKAAFPKWRGEDGGRGKAAGRGGRRGAPGGDRAAVEHRGRPPRLRAHHPLRS